MNCWAPTWLRSLRRCYANKLKLLQRIATGGTPTPLKPIPPSKTALFYFLPCVSLLAKIQRPESLEADIEENITHLIVLARVALEKGDVEKAEALLHMGLKVCEDYKVSFGVPFMYDILASIALARGEVAKAEELLVSVIEKLVADGVAEDDHHVIDFKLRLARVYSDYHDDVLAEIGFKKCLEAQKAKINRGDVSTKTGMLYVNVLFWYGVHMIKNARYAEAKRMVETAYEYSGKIKGLSPYQEMVILYTLAELNVELEEYDMALGAMQTAVMLGKGISSSDLPKCYVSLAKIYVKLGAYDQAKSSAEEGAKLGRMFNSLEAVAESGRILDEINLLEK